MYTTGCYYTSISMDSSTRPLNSIRANSILFSACPCLISLNYFLIEIYFVCLHSFPFFVLLRHLFSILLVLRSLDQATVIPISPCGKSDRCIRSKQEISKTWIN